MNLSLRDGHVVLPSSSTLQKDNRYKSQLWQFSQRNPGTGTSHYQPPSENSASTETCTPQPRHGLYTPDTVKHNPINPSTTSQPGHYLLEQESTQRNKTSLDAKQHFLQHPKQVTTDQIRNIHPQLKHDTQSQLSNCVFTACLWDGRIIMDVVNVVNMCKCRLAFPPSPHSIPSKSSVRWRTMPHFHRHHKPICKLVPTLHRYNNRVVRDLLSPSPGVTRTSACTK